jgi:hypothetical protein
MNRLDEHSYSVDVACCPVCGHFYVRPTELRPKRGDRRIKCRGDYLPTTCIYYNWLPDFPIGLFSNRSVDEPIRGTILGCVPGPPLNRDEERRLFAQRYLS